jgi:sugar phosphate permease
VAYALFLPISLESGYATAILPTMILAGIGFALAYGPLNVAATNGVAEHEQGLASGLVSTSFQFGGALVLAVSTAVAAANTGADGSPQAVLDGFQAAVVVSVIAAGVGVIIATARRRSRPEPAAEPAPAEVEAAAVDAEAA